MGHDRSSKGEPEQRMPTKARGEARRRITSAALFGPGRELIIEHNGREYRLRLTQQGKLILTA